MSPLNSRSWDQVVIATRLLLLFVGLLSGATPLRAAAPSNLSCLAPILDRIDPEAPLDLNEAFLFGPWDEPSLRDDIGTVTFPITTAEPRAAEFFNQAVALLHTFSYTESERSFRYAATLDPTSPMVWWGLALANERRPKRAALFAAEAQRRSHNRADLTERERAWLGLLIAYYAPFDADEEITLESARAQRAHDRTRALETMAFAFPNDIEPRAFLLRQVVMDHHRAGAPIANRVANDLLADRLQQENPDHPSRHYRLFLWLDRNPTLALPHAATAPTISPSVPNGWRYASETFAAAGRLPEAALLSSYALRAAHAEMQRLGEPMADRIEDLVSHYEAHIDQLTSMGRYDEAREAACALIRLPRSFYLEKRHSHVQTLAGSYSTGRRLLGQLHLRLELWNELLAETESGLLQGSDHDWPSQVDSLFWRGLATCNLGQPERAAEILEEMTTAIRRARGAGITTEAEEFLVRLARTLRTQLEFTRGERTEFPADKADLTWLPRDHLARLAYAGGATQTALELVAEELALRPAQFAATANSIDLHFRSGKTREAFYAFDKNFRAHAGGALPSLPVLGRLGAVAAAMQLNPQWRLDPPRPQDLDDLPPPDSIGPATWQPSLAPAFSLPDATGKSTSFTDLGGSPVLLNFFLGAACGFCREQIDGFIPHLPAIKEAEIAFTGVTTDALELLQDIVRRSAQSSPEESLFFPFPVLCNPQHSLFRDLGAYDYFESRPLHGTILLDRSGRVLWRDVGHEPFDHPEPLFHEALRLLRDHPSASSPTQTSSPSQSSPNPTQP